MDIRPSASVLAQRVDPDATAPGIADAIAALWTEIAALLSPIVGPQGVGALYRRCLHQLVTERPWLRPVVGGVPTVIDVLPLREVLATQSAADAMAAGEAMFQQFHALLASLVGSSLTDRLLSTVWLSPGSGPPVQDP